MTGCPREVPEKWRPSGLCGAPARSDPELPGDRSRKRPSSSDASTKSCSRWTCPRTGPSCSGVLTTPRSGISSVIGSRWGNPTLVFAHSVHIKLALPQAAFIFVGKLKISSVAPPRETCLRMHHWLIEVGKIEKKKAQLPVGIKLGNSRPVDWCATTWATTTAQSYPCLISLIKLEVLLNLARTCVRNLAYLLSFWGLCDRIKPSAQKLCRYFGLANCCCFVVYTCLLARFYSA